MNNEKFDMFGNLLEIGDVCYYVTGHGAGGFAVGIVKIYEFKPKMLTVEIINNTPMQKEAFWRAKAGDISKPITPKSLIKIKNEKYANLN